MKVMSMFIIKSNVLPVVVYFEEVDCNIAMCAYMTGADPGFSEGGV